jgi:hypothetical protein
MKRFGARAAICLSAMIWDAAAHADTYVVGVGQSSCSSFTAPAATHAWT